MNKGLDYFLGISEAELDVIFGLEREIGTYGLKSKVFLGFSPPLRWSSLRIEEARNKEFYLKLELCCPSDFRNWLAERRCNYSLIGYSGELGGRYRYRYYFTRTPSELREFVKKCPFVRNCEVSKIESVLKELEIRAFWHKVVRGNV